MSDTDYTEDNVVDITIVITGKAQVIINGEVVDGDEDSHNKVHLNMKEEGDVLVTVNGEDFQKQREPPP